MSLAHTLVGIRDKNPYEIIPHIYKAVAREEENFDLPKLQLTAKEFFEEVTYELEGISNHNKRMEAFFRMYKILKAPAPRSTAFFHASSFGGSCPRRLYYEHNRVPVSDPSIARHSAGTQIIFDLGSMIHNYIQYQLWVSGVLEDMEIPCLDEETGLGGVADGKLVFQRAKVRKAVLEIKSCNSYTFASLQKSTKPLEQHIDQTSIYAHCLKLSHIVTLYIDKSTGQMLEFMLPVDKARYKLLAEKAKKIKSATAPLPRVCKDQFDKNACVCPFVTYCFKKGK